MKINSNAFTSGAAIPKKHTADGADVSPPLAWSDVPHGTQAFALICDDPDAPRGTWVHWVLFNVPATEMGLAELVNRMLQKSPRERPKAMQIVQKLITLEIAALRWRKVA